MFSRDHINILCTVKGANLLSAPRLHRPIFVNSSANESFAHIFIDNHTKTRVISVIFRGEHRKNDAELLAYLHLSKELPQRYF